MWIEAYVEYLRCEKNSSENTIVSSRADLTEFEAYMKSLDEQLTWANADRDVVRQWVADKMERGYSASTVCRNLSSLRSFYKFLLRCKHVDKDPTLGIQGPKKPKLLPQFVREADMDRLLDGNYFPQSLEGLRDRLVVLTFYSTGIRLAELVSLNWLDVDLASGMLKVTGKRNKQRIVPFGEELRGAFEEYRRKLFEEGMPVDDAGPVFLTLCKGSRISRSKVTAIVRLYLSEVTTLKKRSPHVLRHTFATSMLNHDADLQSVKELLGHERITTTEIYTHTTFEELKKMYNQAHPRA
ncbi:MAG: tyrosine-type recombinase/integrase [Prevotellaceae bacterium]|nr:tyrosine-type recombinase/integrase [Prevotellaceae bacterium]